MSPTAIAERLVRSHNIVIKYLDSELFNDPSISRLVDRIKAMELDRLYLLGAKGRMRLHELLDRGDTPMIPTIALVDRVFQQRRLLETKSPQNVATLTRIIEEYRCGRGEALRKGSLNGIAPVTDTNGP